MQQRPTRVFRVSPLDEVEALDGSPTTTPDVLRNRVARTDVSAQEGGVDACVQAGSVPLEQDLQVVGAGEVCACCDPRVDLEEGSADFRFSGDADGGVVVGAVGDEGLEAFEDDAEGEGGECVVCEGR